jgi:hypothetical protein
MTDDARIAHLTELARKAWPDGEEHGVVLGSSYALAYLSEGRCTMLRVNHDTRAVGGMEAALYALAGESPPQSWVVELANRWKESARIARRNGHHGSAKKHEAFADELLAAATRAEGP